jgi:outer membrane protein assembly factor BamA
MKPILIPVLILLVSGLPLAGQKFQPKSIQFKGDSEYSDQELMQAAGLKQGAILTNAEMNEHSQRLMDSGVLNGLTFKFDGQDLIFQLTPSAQMFPIRLENLPLTQGKELDAKLHELFPLYHGKVPSDGGLLENVRGALEEMLASQGIKAAVTATPYSDLKLNKVTLMSFTITDPPVVLGEVRVDGSAPMGDSKVQEILARLSGAPFNFEGSPRQIEVNLGNYYRDKGYLEAEVHATAQPKAIVSAESVRVPFLAAINPGTLYKIEKIELAPTLIVSQADFNRQANIHPGDLADAPRIRENWQFIARQYHNRGYMKAQIEPTPSFNRADGTVKYTVAVEPGPVYSMGALSIENVSDSLRTTMLGAWKLPAGAIFNESAILSFYAIGDANPTLARLFAAVNCKSIMTLNDENHTVDVKLRLEKK